MIYALFEPYIHILPGANLIRYISFRTGMSAVTALVLTFLFARWIIPWLKNLQVTQTIRNDGPKTHLAKEGTPTMGGVLIVGATLFSLLLWGRWDNRFFYYSLLVFISFGLLGFVDDWLKVVLRDPRGIRPRTKLFVQGGVAIGLALLLYLDPGYTTLFYVPFYKHPLLDLGILYTLLVVLIIVGSSNAVNLTDGLDGLAIGVSLIVLGAYGIIAYCTGNLKIAHYLNIPFLPQSGELTVVVGALVGAGMGFLWYNAYPAQIFMGDVGSLSLGGMIGTLAILVKHELLLVLIGGIFVIEALSVMIQVSVYKRTKTRVFRMAPIHHHFELIGWSEPKVVVRFWILAIILAVLGLITLKLR
jgi:phospho-N-acetylmuramoyl-pentapeptide-transferase